MMDLFKRQKSTALSFVKAQKRIVLQNYYRALRRPGKNAWLLMLSDKTKVDHAIVTDEGDTYVVSILKQPNQNKESYVEISMTPSHPLYERIKDVISVLNVAGTLVEIEGIGEAFQTGVYHVVLTPEEHAILLGG